MLPQDNFILLSYINTKLRDEYSSLYDLCEDLNVDKTEIITRLATLGYEYDQNENAFKR